MLSTHQKCRGESKTWRCVCDVPARIEKIKGRLFLHCYKSEREIPGINRVLGPTYFDRSSHLFTTAVIHQCPPWRVFSAGSLRTVYCILYNRYNVIFCYSICNTRRSFLNLQNCFFQNTGKIDYFPSVNVYFWVAEQTRYFYNKMRI